MRIRGIRDTAYSVALGWLGDAAVIHTTRVCLSGQYQTRPPRVTSYCHWGSFRDRTIRVDRAPFKRCCRRGLLG